MSGRKQDDSQILSVRLPHEFVRRLDRYLDWSVFYRRVKLSRNAAMREALSNWLDHQEQLAGFLEPQAQREQFQAAYQSIAKRHDWAAIHHLRHLLPWPRERFDTVLEGLRAEHQIELERAEPGEISNPTIQDSSYNKNQEGRYNQLNSWVVVRTIRQQRLRPRRVDRSPRLQVVRRLDRIMWR